jgi:fatty-acyl-CoA synthase
VPWAAPLVGAKLVYCQTNDPAWICELMREEGVTMVAGVPTVWFAIFQYLDATGQDLPPIAEAMAGGSALPTSVIERLMKAGVRVCHAWGMTETSPVATMSGEPADWDAKSFEEQVAFKALQGRVGYGSEVRAVSLDDPSVVLPRDGKSSGALQVRGHWTIQRYFKADADAAGPDGWFDTGDVALIHPDGSVQLTDRTKDVIKSGGEWISSVDLENAAVAHPEVAEAAAIGVPHPRWDERPILVVVRKPGSTVSGEELCRFLSDKVAKWWLPDAVEFVDEIPHTASGKISKKDLRDQYASYVLPG